MMLIYQAIEVLISKDIEFKNREPTMKGSSSLPVIQSLSFGRLTYTL